MLNKAQQSIARRVGWPTKKGERGGRSRLASLRMKWEDLIERDLSTPIIEGRLYHEVCGEQEGIEEEHAKS